MPTVLPPAKVLVTGANGFIAVWVVKSLLDRGFSVRGTVRSESKGQHLKKLFASFGEKFEVAIVDDITKEGAFDDVVKGVDAIEHTASPVILNAKTPAEVIDPAVKGTVGILQSALKHGSSIKRVVITSSFTAIFDLSAKPPRTFTEADWNDNAVRNVESTVQDASGGDIYQASKTLAEKAAWEFVRKHNGGIQWDLAVLNPPLVFGPAIHEVSSPENLNESAKMLWDAIVAGKLTTEELTQNALPYIDVRDLADAHVLALEKEVAGNERTLLYAGSATYQQMLDIANGLSPHPMPSHTGKLPKGTPGAGDNVDPGFSYDSSKFDKIYGLKLRSLTDTVRDTMVNFEERGW